ncbi:MAG TPA: helix-turn-helix transcriptional regulator [Streptosporangiaceae bacterium]|nr:helix-turn-helix transcriptional regulator [Streptosporangiaceae bacterium]
MSEEAYGVTVAKRRLSRRLAALRMAQGFSAAQVCDKLDWGRGKVNRFESNDWKLPEMSDVRDLLRLYGVSEDEQDVLLDLARKGRVRAWWRKYDEVFDNEFPGYEADAARISVYTQLMLPGLLQTPAYIEAYLTAGSQSAAWVRRAVEARVRRQRILDRVDGTAPRLNAVVTEASLLFRWGSRDDRRAQLGHLAEMSRRPTVDLRVLPFASGPYPGMSALIDIFEFPSDQDPPVVFLETEPALREVTNADEINSYVTLFGRIRDAALSPVASTTFLQKLAETME